MSALNLSSKVTMERLNSKLNEAVSSDISAFGMRMLAKHGWSKGEGIGKNKQGAAEHIKVTKKEADSGVRFHSVC